ncbi:DUF6503 family protein [Flavobacteriaceae bacterium 3-367]
MKPLSVFLMFFLMLISCKEQPKAHKDQEEASKTMSQTAESRYPNALQKVFEAHGGISAWRGKKSLVYDMPKANGKETHTTNLYSRKDRIDALNFSMGFDGEKVWLLDENDSYDGDPVFYHNLMFYFYAMPFILADKGIVYGETEDLVFQGKHYPGVRIRYEVGVGTSYKDEYFIHYDPETYQMTWLGYTVTYRSGEKSDNVKWIRYNDWMEVAGVILPRSITWHAYEGRDIKEAKSTVPFENVVLSETAKPDAFFAKPETAKVVVGKTQ